MSGEYKEHGHDYVPPDVPPPPVDAGASPADDFSFAMENLDNHNYLPAAAVQYSEVAAAAAKGNSAPAIAAIIQQVFTCI